MIKLRDVQFFFLLEPLEAVVYYYYNTWLNLNAVVFLVVFLELHRDSRKRQEFQASSWVGPGKPEVRERGREPASGGAVRIHTFVHYVHHLIWAL